MFLQIHTLTSFPASLLNRDDAGLAKRIPFGDSTRLRVSSQCMKRHWREAMQKRLKLPDGIRSREFFSRIVLPRVIEEKGVDGDRARSLTELLVGKLVSGGVEKENPLSMKQPALFGRPEADFFVELLAECAAEDDEKAAKDVLDDKLKTDKKNFKAMLAQAGHGHLYAGVEGALFGRFVTSDILARSDAAVHVAHPFTVHPIDTEVDYFTVVDDLNRDDETGAAHAGDMELGAGLFYGYVVVDVPLLISNFTGCEPEQWSAQDAGDVKKTLGVLFEAIATVSPGAKLGATAPYARAELALFEAGNQQPRTLANAFLQAQRTVAGGDPMQQAVNSLGEHLTALDQMYGETAERRVVATTKNTGALGDLAAKPFAAAVDEILDTTFGT
jgi:CRISPR system Cascade subunit CasC